MYRILGADGKEYGPVTGEVLRQWISQGRANARTKVKPEGGAEWQALASVAEFERDLAAAPGAAPPPPLPATPAAAKTSGLAITSLVLGVLGLFTCGITALVGLILGIIALVKVNRSGGRLSGQGLAIAGICVSGLFLLMIPMYAAMLLPALARAKQKAQQIKCMNNMKQLGSAVGTYVNDHNGQCPPAATWCDAIQTNVGSPKVFQCPSEPGRCAYAFNAKLEGKKESEVDPQTVVLFESDLGWNGSGGAAQLKPHKHSSRTVNVLLADGAVISVSRSQLGTLRWEP